MSNEIKTLVVDDEDIIAALAGGVAKTMSDTVEAVGSAEDAQSAWKIARHNLIILDLHLPGMSGEEFCEWLRAQPGGEDPFILVCTGDSKLETFKKVLSLGASDYISKPLQPKLLEVRLGVANHIIQEKFKKKGLESELVKNEKRFRLISENSRDLVCTHTADGTLTYASPSSLNLLGIPSESLIGTNLETLRCDERFHPINLTAHEDEANGMLESTRIWEARRKDGKSVWLETFSQATKDPTGKIQEIYSYSRDITEQKQEEEQLRILGVIGEETDTKGFLDAILSEMKDRLDADIMIHIHGKPGERETTRLPEKEKMAPATREFHTELDKNTHNEKVLFQSTGAGNVFNHLPESENLEAVICLPIPGRYGKPVGKITISKTTSLPESERTKAILDLCAHRIGAVLEDHVTR